ncbi:hypothetical protein ACW9H6_19685 [Pseudomonas sp. SDO528_S397]
MEKINLCGRMLLIVLATSLGTETVVASNPVGPVAFDGSRSLSESGSDRGLADPTVHRSYGYQEHQRWVF